MLGGSFCRPSLFGGEECVRAAGREVARAR